MNPNREQSRRNWLASVLAGDDFSIERASEDASFRSYWRVTHGATTRILMDAPPGREALGPWLDIAARLRAAGVHAPRVDAHDAGHGFILMEDLGGRTYLPELDDSRVDVLYADALDALLRMQHAVDTTGLPGYDRDRLVAEMELLPEWFLGRHLGCTPSGADRDVIEAAFAFLVDAADEQPRAFVHRDFHSRNLLVTADNSPGVIDFQDAVVGPLAYDLVSLLRDCYIEWDEARIAGWVEAYRLRLGEAHLLDASVDATRFRRWFDLIGVQRHLKVLGIFCRLWYRDGKAQYLGDLPLTWRHATSVARRYPELVDLVALLERARGDRDLTVARAMAGA